jgi:hypothetical protein
VQAVTGITGQAAVLRSGETRSLLVRQLVPFLHTDHRTSCTGVPFLWYVGPALFMYLFVSSLFNYAVRNSDYISVVKVEESQTEAMYKE